MKATFHDDIMYYKFNAGDFYITTTMIGIQMLNCYCTISQSQSYKT